MQERATFNAFLRKNFTAYEIIHDLSFKFLPTMHGRPQDFFQRGAEFFENFKTYMGAFLYSKQIHFSLYEHLMTFLEENA